MNERLIVQLSEIILAVSALAGIIIVLAAAWYDLRVTTQKKRLHSPSLAANLNRRDGNVADLSVSALFDIYAQLSGTMLKKALLWRKPFDHIHRSVPDKAPPLPPTSKVVRITLKLFQMLLLGIFIGLSTYFFYTAAILQSSTLLTLSWTIACLWLIAIVWSNDTLRLSRKIELTFTIPFMYFAFYAYSHLQLMSFLYKAIPSIQSPKIQIRKVVDAFQVELYSTRY